MTEASFTHTGKPDHGEVVEVLLEPPDGNGWLIQLARWSAHQAQWIHEWTKRPIIDEIVGWRERVLCSCAS